MLSLVGRFSHLPCCEVSSSIHHNQKYSQECCRVSYLYGYLVISYVYCSAFMISMLRESQSWKGILLKSTCLQSHQSYRVLENSKAWGRRLMLPCQWGYLEMWLWFQWCRTFRNEKIQEHFSIQSNSLKNVQRDDWKLIFEFWRHSFHSHLIRPSTPHLFYLLKLGTFPCDV